VGREGERQTDRKEPKSQYPFHGHAPNDLSSPHKAPPSKGSTTSQQYHKLGTTLLTQRPLRDIHDPNYSTFISCTGIEREGIKIATYLENVRVNSKIL
jgi:hypothetical protein